VPGPGSDFAGPFASFRPVPFDDLRVLRGSDGSLASDAAAATVRAWGQHLAGYRDVPLIRAEEYVAGGDLVVTVSVAEGNAPVIDVSLRTLEAGALHPFDFKAPLHRRRPEPMPWRDVPVLFDGHAPDFTGRWVGRFPLLPGVNQAYLVLVRTRVGDAVTEHALPVRPIWHGGDPALGPARP